MKVGEAVLKWGNKWKGDVENGEWGECGEYMKYNGIII